MRKLFSVALVVLLSLGSFGYAGAEAPDVQAAIVSLAEHYAEVAPLDEATTIRYGDGVGYQLSVPLYIAWKYGGFERCGIDLEFYPSNTGPLRVEALAAGEIDMFGSGIGGIAVGCAQGTAKMITYINDDSVIQKFYVAKDDPLASAPMNEFGFRGTAEDWRGREVYLQSGSTLQYLMGHCLSNLNLTLQDITPVYMDAPNVNAAMFAGKGQTWGVWNFQCYDQDLVDGGFVPVMDEPFGALDAQTRYSMQNELRAIAEKDGRTIVFVTNNIEEALLLGDRIILLTSCPAQVKQVYDIDIVRPRDTMDAKFLHLRKMVSDNMDLAL